MLTPEQIEKSRLHLIDSTGSMWDDGFWSQLASILTPQPTPHDEARNLLSKVLHLWEDSYIAKNPKSQAVDSIAEGVFEDIRNFLPYQHPYLGAEPAPLPEDVVEVALNAYWPAGATWQRDKDRMTAALRIAFQHPSMLGPTTEEELDAILADSTVTSEAKRKLIALIQRKEAK